MALALTAAACSSGGGGGGGGGTSSLPPPACISTAGSGTPTPVDCSWFTGANCIKTAATAAKACTNAALTGTFNADTSRCTYSDGASVVFDPAMTATMAYEQFGPWDFDLLTSTATCANYRETDSSFTLGVCGLGTFFADYSADPIVFTCPDGSRHSMAYATAEGCISSFPGWVASRSGGTLSFAVVTPPSNTTLWKCR